MGRLTTHILDTAAGQPAAGVHIRLERIGDSGPETLTQTVTNSDGRCDQPLLEGERFTAGTYQLVFAVGDYFAGAGVDNGEPRFLDQVVLRFGIASPDQHYHVPLLLSPYGYTTYRGS
ncbi:MAG: hydroxyisourate hydrolase [Ectothiorhodospiraceae bacterium]|nr:hydroxyisourate hydrolase [Ectothiorhodospiraceae bacterium]MCH8505080.1 hydroxyisourate hydrolase [Ectothiorhodospiraceae bacterium]